MQITDFSRTWSKFFIRIFCINPHFYCSTGKFYILLLYCKMLPGCYFYLFFYKVNTCHHLCDTVLNLNSRIYFHKIKIFIFIKQKFYSSGISISYCSRCSPICCLVFSSRAADGDSSTIF